MLLNGFVIAPLWGAVPVAGTIVWLRVQATKFSAVAMIKVAIIKRRYIMSNSFKDTGTVLGRYVHSL